VKEFEGGCRGLFKDIVIFAGETE